MVAVEIGDGAGEDVLVEIVSEIIFFFAKETVV
jgi:hypothetical protein